MDGVIFGQNIGYPGYSTTTRRLEDGGQQIEDRGGRTKHKNTSTHQLRNWLAINDTTV